MVNLPEPIENVDYYIEETHRYTVTITVESNSISQNDEQICSKAVDDFVNGKIDGDYEIVHSEHVDGKWIDMETDGPFNLRDWQISQMAMKGLRIDGTPLRSGEKTRPASETTLGDY